jgi:DNA-binding NarL/FixJ family response regulator
MRPQTHTTDSTKPEDTLMPSEFEVCDLLVKGLNCKQSGRELGRSANSVTVDIKHAMQKMGMENRVMLALRFTEKYPDEASRREGYRDACVRVIQSLKARRRMRRG